MIWDAVMWLLKNEIVKPQAKKKKKKRKRPKKLSYNQILWFISAEAFLVSLTLPIENQK